jgi:hypothetical protein
MSIKFVTTDKPITSISGLAYIGQQLDNKEFFYAINKVSRIKQASGFISDFDCIKTMIGLISIGKPDFDAVEEYRNDKFFKKCLKLKKVPSSPTLRQRIEEFSDVEWDIIRSFNVRLLSEVIEDEFVMINGKMYLTQDNDVTVLDNSNTKKEGVSWTYKKVDGYAPMMSYIGKNGFMLNTVLREGSDHSNCSGTLEYFLETLDMAHTISDIPVLIINDSGNDDIENILAYERNGAHYIVKRNLRKESKEEWFSLAQSHSALEKRPREGKVTYYASILRTVKFKEKEEARERSLRIVVVATERKLDHLGQPFLIPEIDIETYWVNLDASDEEVEELYHQHGTSEQYHAEWKSELGLERLPSGKFAANSTIMLLGMIAFNLLRRLGKDALLSNKAPGKRRSRIRLRTVILNLVYMGGLIVEGVRDITVRLWSGHGWTEAYMSVF